MSKTAIVFAATHFEEIELITAVDVLRRGNVKVTVVSLTGEKRVVGAHGVEIETDALFSDKLKADVLVLPGGGVLDHYLENKQLQNLIQSQDEKDKWIAAICAAPCLLGEMGLLDNKTAVCYPGMEEYLESSVVTDEAVEIDGNIITSKAPATALPFAITVLEQLEPEHAETVRDEMHVELVYDI